ncbi:uncharacterized protein LOC117481626 isoform X1 [Trematomus bernacchii]|uniref:uncharacterized protein LOC117481626 isoform X1 n=1 Tax=Trematomus bernacchii TaxID=40690 RepID=UPI00146A9989|nr:uncharacterized protein LOC117481626 isoform X1 [Trematomus bernacchii]
MEGFRIFLVILLVVSCTHDWTSGSELEMTVRPGHKITLYCDCKLSSGVYIVWYRNCSHENQPSLVLNVKEWRRYFMDINYSLNPLPRFHFVRNSSSESYDLLIVNITETDERLYYCGTDQFKLEQNERLTFTHIYTNVNISTRIHVIPDSSSCPHPGGHILNPVVPWMMVLTPAVTILTSFISFILVYLFCQKTDKDPQILQKRLNTRIQTRWDQDEDLCFTRVVFRAKDGRKQQ